MFKFGLVVKSIFWFNHLFELYCWYNLVQSSLNIDPWVWWIVNKYFINLFDLWKLTCIDLGYCYRTHFYFQLVGQRSSNLYSKISCYRLEYLSPQPWGSHVEVGVVESISFFCAVQVASFSMCHAVTKIEKCCIGMLWCIQLIMIQMLINISFWFYY